MENSVITQGDEFDLGIIIKTKDGLLNIAAVDEVEFVIGNIRKVFPTEVKYNRETGKFVIPLTQNETFRLKTETECQARVKFTGGEVRASRILVLENGLSLSKVVL